ncbi:MAG: glycoside hydrolase family 3 protein [Eggerthellaceae bacterium]|nr:glycoside hydrolase family 3 protein [Eggerthellaceae bacterium]
MFRLARTSTQALSRKAVGAALVVLVTATTLAITFSTQKALADESATKLQTTTIGTTPISTTASTQGLVSCMTLEQKVGQVIFAHANKSGELTRVARHQYGGCLLFARDFKGTTKKKLKKRLAKLQSVSAVPMLIGVDEEGGNVVRASCYKAFRKSRFKSPSALRKRGGYKAVKKDALTKSSFLKGLGINTNFAPVVDVPYKSRNYIYKRAYSTKVKQVMRYSETVVKAMNSRGLVSALKHFPGYGGNGDTHGRIVIDMRALSTFQSRDLLPFQSGINAGCPMIMMSHNVVFAFDRGKPASISAPAHDYLRGVMGFNGVIITDSLGMNGVRRFAPSAGELAVQAFLAGNDMLCTPYPEKMYDALLAAVKSGRISEKRLDESVRRILALKMRYGIMNVG